MSRVLVVAAPGAGGDDAVRRIADRWHLAVHGADDPDLARAVATDGWVVEAGERPEVRELLWSSADTLVWLDLPRRTVLAGLLAQLLRHPTSHPLRLLLLVWRVLTSYGERRHLLERRTAVRPHLRTHRLRTPRALEAWLEGGLEGDAGS